MGARLLTSMVPIAFQPSQVLFASRTALWVQQAQQHNCYLSKTLNQFHQVMRLPGAPECVATRNFAIINKFV